MRERIRVQPAAACPAHAIEIPMTARALGIACLLMSAGPLFAATVPVSDASVHESISEKIDLAPGAPWGIRIIGIRRTASDYMLDFRYRVLDADKAAYLMDRKIKPQLVVEKSGRKLQVPVSSKIGPLRQSPKFTKPNRDYFMLFANPGRMVQAGDKVTVVIGDFRAEHLVVE